MCLFFRGHRGDMIKLLWFDGDGLCLFVKRLERGRPAKSQDEYRRGYGLHLFGDRRSGILGYLPGKANTREEDAARWKQKPTAVLFARAPML